MSRIPEAILDAIRDRVDLVALIGRHVGLKKAGRSHKGLCPFHDEKTPSFSVNGDSGYYYCFGCGVKGNAFTYLMEHDNLTFPEAAKSLADETGIELKLTADGPAGESEALEHANRTAQEYFVRSLLDSAGEKARNYLDKRGFDNKSIERFEIGFAPDSWDGLVRSLGRERIRLDLSAMAGLVKERETGGYYDLLRGRITFPIRDPRGRIVAFGGRALEIGQEPKYLNSPETPLFRKREAFYGFPDSLEPIRTSGRAIIVEGYFDRVALAKAGLRESLATCGTALSEGHAKSLRRRTHNVTLLFDGDNAGKKAVLRSLEVLLPAGLRVRAAQLPSGLDPDDFLRERGPEALKELADDALPALDLAIENATKAGCQSPWEKADAVASVAPLLALITDSVERGSYARQLALMAGVEVSEIEIALRASTLKESAGEDLVPRRPQLTTPVERRLADAVSLALHFPELRTPLVELFDWCHPPEPWPQLTAVVQNASVSGDLLKSCENLPNDAQNLLFVLAEDSEDLSQETANKVFLDTATWLRKEFARREARETTKELRIKGNDPGDLLSRKQQQLEARRSAMQMLDRELSSNNND